MDQRDGVRLEDLAALTSGDANSLGNIFRGLEIGKWEGSAPQGDALPQLAKRRPRENSIQFGLS